MSCLTYSKAIFNFDPNDGVGQNGFLYYLGTRGYTEPYQLETPIGYSAPEKSETDLPVSKSFSAKQLKNNLKKESHPDHDKETTTLGQFDVSVHFSQCDLGKPVDFLSKKPADIYLGMVSDTYIDIQLPVKFKPNYYSIWNCGESHRCGFALYNWNLLGWNDRLKEWVVIRNHVNDKTITPKPFSRGDFELECDDYYQIFRIKSTGNNQYSGHPGLMISTAEFYGQVFQHINGDKIYSMKDKTLHFLFV